MLSTELQVHISRDSIMVQLRLQEISLLHIHRMLQDMPTRHQLIKIPRQIILILSHMNLVLHLVIRLQRAMILAMEQIPTRAVIPIPEQHQTTPTNHHSLHLG